MKKFLIALTVFLVWSFFGLWLYSWFQTENQTSDLNTELAEIVSSDTSGVASEEISVDINTSEAITTTKTLPEVDSLSLNKKVINSGLIASTSTGDLIFRLTEGVSILKNSSEVFIPKTSTDFKYKTNAYLLEHPNVEVHINSIYSATENFETPNLGVLRGRKIKEILINTGVPKEKIVIKPVIKGIDFNEEGFYDNSISLTFKPLDLERLESLKTELPTSRIVYPKFSNTGILINNNLRDLLKEVKEITTEQPEVRIELIGHTDNIGNGQDNFQLALNYAQQVKWYLVNKGAIKNSKIKASSKGESEPIADNSSNQGRVANRRIEVVFYK